MGTRFVTAIRLGALMAAGTVAVLASQAPGTAIRIGPRDKVTVTVIDAPEYSGKYTVDADGTFEYAPLGLRLTAGGLTTGELAAAVKKELAARVFNNPHVTVELESSAHMRVIVTGAVGTPATYAFAGELRILEALARAGSTAPDAGEEALVVRAGAPAEPAGPDGPSKIRVDLHALLSGDMKENVLLHDGDTVIVLKAEPFYINGYVKSPGQYPYRRGMTVEQAITLAGGVSEQGRANGKVKIKRVGQSKDISATAADPIRAGDIITVPRRIV
jgi:polysaccharide export outer membrane protein